MDETILGTIASLFYLGCFLFVIYAGSKAWERYQREHPPVAVHDTVYVHDTAGGDK